MIPEAVRCEEVWKRYPFRTTRYQTLRHDLGALLRRANPFKAEETEKKFLWALRDLSLNVAPGQALGIIGPNGSGKSTLLKLLAGVTYPTRGVVEVRGRIGALIEVGAGIHPELTGRENIFLYGSVIGLNRREVQRKFDSIVEFAELENFLDVPVKRYSSGMKIRLGFSIAAHVDPDILLVDEVLAVGDARFQRKCLARIKSMLESDITILYVSHELTSLERLCERALWLDQGVVRQLGPSAEVVRAYLREVETRFSSHVPIRLTSPGGFVLDRIELLAGEGADSHVRTGEALAIKLFYESPADFVPAQVAIKVLDDRMTTVTMAVWDGEESEASWRPGRGTMQCTFHSLPLGPRLYQVWVQVLRHPDLREELPWTLATTFPILDGQGGGDRIAGPLRGREAPLMIVPTTWELQAQTDSPVGREPS
jgi:ABC-type polysaccharide/polyol phosphate transport system ATPase subunit